MCTLKTARRHAICAHIACWHAACRILYAMTVASRRPPSTKRWAPPHLNGLSHACEYAQGRRARAASCRPPLPLPGPATVLCTARVPQATRQALGRPSSPLSDNAPKEHLPRTAAWVQKRRSYGKSYFLPPPSRPPPTGRRSPSRHGRPTRGGPGGVARGQHLHHKASAEPINSIIVNAESIFAGRRADYRMPTRGGPGGRGKHGHR